MAFSPLWSSTFGLLGKHSSNAEVENHMKHRKRNLKANERLAPAEFVSRTYIDTKKAIDVIVRCISIEIYHVLLIKFQPVSYTHLTLPTNREV